MEEILRAGDGERVGGPSPDPGGTTLPKFPYVHQPGVLRTLFFWGFMETLLHRYNG